MLIVISGENVPGASVICDPWMIHPSIALVSYELLSELTAYATEIFCHLRGRAHNYARGSICAISRRAFLVEVAVPTGLTHHGNRRCPSTC